jgi:integrase
VLVKEMPDQLGALVLLCAWCALRVGEVLELRRRDLDLNRGVVNVTRAVSWVRGPPIVGTPKSAAGTRELSVPPHIVPALEQHLENYVRPGADALTFPSMRDHQRHLQPTCFTRPAQGPRCRSP